VDIERVYINKIARTGTIESSMSAGIRDSHFEDQSLAQIYAFLSEHTRKYKGSPSLEVIRERFPGHNFESTSDSVSYLRERFIRHTKQRFARESLVEIAKQLDDPDVADEVDSILLGEARRLSMLVPTSEVTKFSDIHKRIERYELGADQNVGIKMGIPEFDKVTLGIQPHEFVAVVGWQGLGKSTLTQWMLFNAYMQGKTAMIISLEMEASALMRKWDTMLTHFRYSDLKSHELSPQDLENWRIKADEVKARQCDIIVKDQVMDCTPDFVYAETMRWKPDIVAVDYISLMDASRTSGNQMWERLTHLTRQLKQIARSSGVPIIGVAQTNIASADGGAKLDNIAYSRSIGQDADIVIGLHQDDEMKANNKMTARLLKNRDGSTVVSDLVWNMDRMKFSKWSDVEYFENKKRSQELIEAGEHMVDPETGEIVDE
jgi:replicative DNA helicase